MLTGDRVIYNGLALGEDVVHGEVLGRRGLKVGVVGGPETCTGARGEREIRAKTEGLVLQLHANVLLILGQADIPP